MQTFFILGTNPDISLEELRAVTGAKPSKTTEEVAVFDDIDTELTTLNKRLGGVQKLGHIIGSIKRDSVSEIVDFLSSMLIANQIDGKIHFGISIYFFGDAKRTKELQADAQKIGLETKKALKNEGLSVRYATSKDPTLSAVSVTKNHLLEKGAEFVLLVGEKEVLVGSTSAVQDYEDWSFRDFDRPGRDAKRGMLPPKLARIMVNMLGVDPKDKTLLDPFCGSGTILMEAALVGFEKLRGSDILEKAVTDTEENLTWLAEQDYNIPDFKLCETKASNIIAHIKPNTIDTIATEPFLGKPRQGDEMWGQVQESVDELAELYKESFGALYKILKPGGVIVLVNPVHMVEDQEVEAPMKKIMENIGFKIDPDFPSDLLYHRKGQFVGRHLMKFVK